MNFCISKRFSVLILVSTLFLSLFLAVAYTAHAHGDEDHSVTSHMESDIHDEFAVEDGDTPRVIQMKMMLTLLTQLVALLSEQVETTHADHDDHHDDSHDDGDMEDLVVWIEIHSNETHAHVQEPGKELETFFLEDLEYTEEEAIVNTIAERTGISAHEIEAVITFPSGEVDENGDSMDEEEEDHNHDHEEVSLDGLHIMADGTIMLGSGEELEGATITEDGNIMLEDGDVVEPEFDLR